MKYIRNTNSYAKYMIFLLFYGIIIHLFLIDIGFPNAIKYLFDLIILFLFFHLIFHSELLKLCQGHIFIIIFFGLWYLYMVLSTIGKGFNFFLIAWATRNWGRGILFFISVITIFDKDDYLKVFIWLKRIYILHFAMTIFQYIVLGLKQDYNSGVFGTERGSNSYSNIFICVILIIILTEVYEKKKCSWNTLCFLCSTMVIAGLQELKIYYIEFLLLIFGISVIYLLYDKKNFSLFLRLFLFSIIAMVIGLYSIWLVSPRQFMVLTGKRTYADYENTSRVYYKISRIHAIREINDTFFKDNLKLRLFGYGFGNCEYCSAWNRLISYFYYQYGDYNYIWCTHMMLYLEGGLIGLLLYSSSFVLMMFYGLYQCMIRKNVKLETVALAAFSGLTLINMIYNSALRTELSYLVFFVLAFALSGSVPEGKINND